jgi:hypothetical protein
VLLTITTTAEPASDLGFLLHKHPGRVQAFDVSTGVAHVFYPEVGDARTTAALLLEVDPVGLVRGRQGPAGEGFALGQYVNDRPYAASSMLAVAIKEAFRTALTGRCAGHQELADSAIPLELRVPALPGRGGAALVRRVFEPLGWQVTAVAAPLDPTVPDWGPGATRVGDFGCGEGALVRDLLADHVIERVVATDVSARALQIADRRLRLDSMSGPARERLEIFQSPLTYRDDRLAGLDAAVLMEVIEHVDPSRLAVLERVVFGSAAPSTVIVTTPNVEYNVRYQTLPPGTPRHRDHRFEWTRAQFRDWAAAVADRNGYRTRFLPVGGDDPEVGPPTQMADAIVDAETGCLLRLIAYDGDAPAEWLELDGVTAEPGGTADPAGFRPHIPPGTRVVEESGAPLVDATAVMPGLTGTAARAAAEAFRCGTGAVSAACGFLDDLRGQR